MLLEELNNINQNIFLDLTFNPRKYIETVQFFRFSNSLSILSLFPIYILKIYFFQLRK